MSDGYNAGLFANLWLSIKERLRGERAKANARWGFVHPLAKYNKKVVWIKTTSSLTSVKVAKGLAEAICVHRRDVIPVLTYEKEFRDLFDGESEKQERLLHGYGPANHPWALRRILRKWLPLGIIFVETPPSPTFISLLKNREIPMHAVGSLKTWQGFLDREAVTAHITTGLSDRAVDLLTTLTHSHVEPVLRGSMPECEQSIWCWLYGIDKTSTSSLFSSWVSSPLSEQGVLFITPENKGCAKEIEKQAISAGLQFHMMAEWARGRVGAKPVVLVEDPAWFVTLAASVSMIHLLNYDRTLYWQALSLGVPLSATEKVSIELPLCSDGLVEINDGFDPILRSRAELLKDSFQLRRVTDRERQLFWQQRRSAQQEIEKLLQRVYEW